jgi:hypothetical protein
MLTLMAARLCLFATMTILAATATAQVEYSAAPAATSTSDDSPPAVIGAAGGAPDTGTASQFQGADPATTANTNPAPLVADAANVAVGAIPMGSADYAGFTGGDASAQTAFGKALSASVIQMGESVSAVIHATGGYRFDGYNDCYGFVRRTWDPLLAQMHTTPAALPVDDYPSKTWYPITNWNALVPGDVLGTVQGHSWGANVDYGMYGGVKNGVQYTFANGGGAGPVFAPANTTGGWYRYYYGPTHALLTR